MFSLRVILRTNLPMGPDQPVRLVAAIRSGGNSANINRQPDRLELLNGIGLTPAVLDDIPTHRITRLRRQGEQYFTDGLRDITSDRRLAILAICVVEWAAAISDTVVKTRGRIVGAIWRDEKRICRPVFPKRG